MFFFSGYGQIPGGCDPAKEPSFCPNPPVTLQKYFPLRDLQKKSTLNSKKEENVRILFLFKCG
jgi:hypothetical protein